MVKNSRVWLNLLLLGMSGIMLATAAQATLNERMSQLIEADACDNRRSDDDAQTAENRAVDKASLAAIKLSGIVQKQYPRLSSGALDLIAYRIIDEHLANVNHDITVSDEEHICVKLQATLEITPDELTALINEYKYSGANASSQQIVEVAEQVNATALFKPQNLNEKKLLYINKTAFWNGVETNHYHDLLTGLFSHSDYFYVTDNQDIADYLVTPRLLQAQVDEIDSHNHKMQMLVELDTISKTMEDFAPLQEKQNHFIMFAADKDEQEVADTLLRKLLTRAANNTGAAIDKYMAAHLEQIKLHGN